MKLLGDDAAPLAAAPAADYPPLGLAPGVKKLEGWIQLGCGDKPYYCEEKNATFPSDTVTRPGLVSVSGIRTSRPADLLGRQNLAGSPSLRSLGTMLGLNLCCASGRI